MVRKLWCIGLLFGLATLVASAQEAQQQKPKTYRPVAHSTVTIVKIDPAKNTITVKGIYRGQEIERTLLVQVDSKLMKDGKDAKIGDFKEGEQVIVTWRSLKKGEYAVRFLADPPTFFAFLRYPTIKGKVKSFDAATLTIAIEAEGKEHKLTLPGRGECCFASGKSYRGKAAVWKGGEEVIAVLSAPDRARAVFDSDSWKLYGEREWQSYQKRAQARQQKGQEQQ
ncbi:MAG: hypothetical protein NZ805_04105 [Armatimonadetes bacterium]|nr:hypothetical protein [Armatimonadota bacterium]MDW8028965.1 hypothetical protein [Armatimonadota bacterium]